MGKFTARDDPEVDRLIETHMQRIVSAIVARMEPTAIILRGSFGRGEGSVLTDNGRIHFLSDYEIDVASFSPFHRSFFSRLSGKLSSEFGMEAGVRWIRPDCLARDRIGPFPLGKAAITISLYEFRYGSRVLYGQDFISNAPDIDPGDILLESGIRLLLNRMAESLLYMPPAKPDLQDGFAPYHWINKTILACAESLLLLWKEYQYSYEERGRRFARAGEEKLNFMPDNGTSLKELVVRATEFKLRPDPSLYPYRPHELWSQVIPACGLVFRHIFSRSSQHPFDDYVDFPEAFLRRDPPRLGLKARVFFAAQKSYELYRAARARCVPRSLFSPFHASRIVYAVTPLLFLGYVHPEQEILACARCWLSLLGTLRPLESNPQAELDYLCRKLTAYWKIFCY